MKATVVLAVLSLALVTVALAPSAGAVGTCTFLDPKCPALACVGTSWSYPDPYYRCQYQVGERPPEP